MKKFHLLWIGFCAFACAPSEPESAESLSPLKRPNAVERPNIVLIYADDLGYGDVSSYGATTIDTPNIDRIAEEGIRFTRAYSSSATCTPSRFSLLTGRYAWRQQGTAVARGDAGLIIDPQTTTLADVLGGAGYATGVVGKWHLGLGGKDGPDWNEAIAPGPAEIGFDYSFLVPATGDRVPSVYVENGRVVGLDPADPITVSYGEPVGDWPTGRADPELLEMGLTHGHDHTIVNGISRTGYMTGGASALWDDYTMADVLVEKSRAFLEDHASGPFFLFLSTHDIHVPRTPHSRFQGKSGMGPRGDAILQLDWTVGAVMATLEELGLANDTLLIFTSDNGPVLDDGYADQARELVGEHRPAGSLRGGKYSLFEAGTRVPTIVRWPDLIEAGSVSEALISQVDFLASVATLVGSRQETGFDSEDHLDALLGRSKQGRTQLVQDAIGNRLALVQGQWKYIEPSDGPAMLPWGPIIETGFSGEPQLYDLTNDPGERNNLASSRQNVVARLAAALEEIKAAGAE